MLLETSALNPGVWGWPRIHSAAGIIIGAANQNRCQSAFFLYQKLLLLNCKHDLQGIYGENKTSFMQILIYYSTL